MKKLLILLVLIGFPLLVGLAQNSGGESSGGAGIDSGGTGGVPSGGSESGGSGSGGTVEPEPPVQPEPPVIVPPVTPEPQPQNSNTFIDVDCSDFDTSEEAQAFFDGYTSVLRYDAHKLDRDGDGVVCSSLR